MHIWKDYICETTLHSLLHIHILKHYVWIQDVNVSKMLEFEGEWERMKSWEKWHNHATSQFQRDWDNWLKIACLVYIWTSAWTAAHFFLQGMKTSIKLWCCQVHSLWSVCFLHKKKKKKADLITSPILISLEINLFSVWLKHLRADAVKC